jgi:hypothetical protein
VRWPRTALQELEELDLTMAVQYGGADARLIKIESRQTVPWTEGRKLYESHVERPIISGEPHPSTAKRYRAVFDKFIPFAEAQGRRTWNELNRQLMDDYACWLDGESDASATEYLELTTLKQILKFLIENRHPPNSAAFSDPLRKPDGTTRWTRPPPPLCEKIKIEAAAPSSLGLRANCAGERERTRPNDRGEAQERRSPDWHSFGTVGCANQDFCSQLTDLQQVAATTQNKRRGRDSSQAVSATSCCIEPYACMSLCSHDFGRRVDAGCLWLFRDNWERLQHSFSTPRSQVVSRAGEHCDGLSR